MKRIFSLALALFCAASFGATLNPISLLNPAGSTSGQTILSTGPTSAPVWGGISAATLTGVVPITNGGTGQANAAAALTALGGLSTTTAASTYAPKASPTFSGTVSIATGGNPNAALAITSTGGNGAGITLTGDGATTPNKTLRVQAGQLQILNSAYSATPLTLTDTGALTITGGLGAAGGTFTGSTSVAYSNATFTLNDTSASNKAQTIFQKNGTTAWALSNSSSTGALAVDRFVSGAYVDSPVSVSNSTGVVTFSDGISVPSGTTLNQPNIVGVTSNTAAPTGSVGEYPTPVTGSAISLTNATSANLATTSLGAGDWRVQCTAQFTATSPSIMTNATVGVSTTSATLGTLGSCSAVSPTGNAAAGYGDTLPTPLTRQLLSGTTTIYCVGNASFSGAGGVTGQANITAWRVR